MSVTDADIAFATDLFADIGGLTTRKMMGGMCVYARGTIFAIVHGDGGLYLKARGDFAAELAAMGASQWTYQRDGGKLTGMPYWSLPEAALDDPTLACDLGRRALTYLEKPHAPQTRRRKLENERDCRQSGRGPGADRRPP